MREASRITRARILEAALQLLNERGVGEVTVRDVASQANMSHGNLCYHFANMGAVIDALYDELVRESDASAADIIETEASLELLHRLQAATFELMLKYRFLFLDFVAVFRARAALRRRLVQLKRRRAREFLAFTDWAEAGGLLAPERHPGERELLFGQYDLMSDFWLSQATILHDQDPSRAKSAYQRLTFSVLIPHLSRKGYEQCRALGLLEPPKSRRPAARRSARGARGGT